jgi:hypothetical protein
MVVPPQRAQDRREIAEPRHSSLYAPRDFDISPYFMVVKPTLARGFNYNALGRPGAHSTAHACSRDRKARSRKWPAPKIRDRRRGALAGMLR